jgi:hypothetical protein
LHLASAQAKAEGIVAAELKRRRWREGDLKRRRKNDLDKLEVGARLRRETTMSLEWVAQQLGFGSWKYLSNLLGREHDRSRSEQPELGI